MSGGRSWVRARRGDPERGSGTVLALALMAVTLVLAAALGLLVGAQGARGQAQAGADLGALAAAAHLVSRGTDAVPDACAVAAEVAARNGARLASCTSAGAAVVDVTVTRRSTAGTATAHARAGPASAREP